MISRRVKDILYFVKYDASGLVDAEHPYDSSKYGDAKNDLIVRDREEEDVVVFDTIRGIRLRGLAALL